MLSHGWHVFFNTDLEDCVSMQFNPLPNGPRSNLAIKGLQLKAELKCEKISTIGYYLIEWEGFFLNDLRHCTFPKVLSADEANCYLR